MPDIDIRPAREDDAAFLAWVSLAATRGHLDRGWFDIALEMPEAGCLDFLARLTRTEQPAWWHYTRFLIAEVDGAPAGALCAFRGGDAYPLSQAAMLEVTGELGWSEAEVAAMWDRAAYWWTCPLAHDDDAWAIDNVAVKPAFRGLGLGHTLVAHALDLGRKAGFDRAQLSVMIGNDRARRTYEAAGFTLAEEKRSPVFETASGSPGLWRFTRTL